MADESPPPVPVDYLSVEPESPPVELRAWSGYFSFGLALFQMICDCGGLFRPFFSAIGASWDVVDHRAFVIGRIVMFAPTIIAVPLACIALIGSPRRRYLWAPRWAIGITVIWLLFSSYAIHWHAGD